jgi:hypothetical protein
VIKEKLPERDQRPARRHIGGAFLQLLDAYRRRSSWFGVLKGDDDSPAARIVDHMLSTTVYSGEADAFRALDSYGTFREQVSKGLDAIIREHAPALLDDVR